MGMLPTNVTMPSITALSVSVVMIQLCAITCIQVPVMEMASPVMYRVNGPLRNRVRTLWLLDVGSWFTDIPVIESMIVACKPSCVQGGASEPGSPAGTLSHDYSPRASFTA